MSTTTAPAEARLITGQELLALGDIGPRELIDGRIVALAPPGAEHGEMWISGSNICFCTFATQTCKSIYPTKQ